LQTIAWNVALTVGPLGGAFLVALWGYQVAYTIDAVLFTAALWAVAPAGHPAAVRRRRAGARPRGPPAPRRGVAVRRRRPALPRDPAQRPHDVPRRPRRDGARVAARAPACGGRRVPRGRGGDDRRAHRGVRRGRRARGRVLGR